MQYIKENGKNLGDGIKIKISVDNGRLISFSPEYIVSQIFGFLKTEFEPVVPNPARIVINVPLLEFLSRHRFLQSGDKTK